jgi:hypothetical protein
MTVPTQVRIMFMNCPRLDTLACAYLLLAQNEVQKEFEFSVQHYWVYAAQNLTIPLRLKAFNSWSGCRLPFRKWAFGKYTTGLDLRKAPLFRTEMDSRDFSPHIAQLLQGHDAWFRSLPSSYGGRDYFDGSTIVVTETPFKGAYFASAEGKVAIISVAHWQSFSPPSVLEFVLRMVQRYTARIAFAQTVGSHYSTRGCIWDFDANVYDAKITTAVSFICAQCDAALSQALPTEKSDALRKLVDHKWIGRIEDTGSIGSNLRRIFQYDLARTTGLSPGFFDRVRDIGSAQLAALFVKTIVVVVTSALSLLVLHKLKFNIMDFLPKP